MSHTTDLRHFQFLSDVGVLEQSASGVRVGVDGELFDIDVLRHDVLRLRLTKNRAHDPRPSFAVVGDVGTPAPFIGRRTQDSFEIETESLLVRLGTGPFGLDVFRRDGAPVLRSYRLSSGASRTYGALNDEFALVRRCGVDDVFLGLGQKTGGLNRKGRDYVMWNTDVLDPRATWEFVRYRREGDPAKDPTSDCFDPYYMSIPLFYQVDRASGAAAGFFIDNAWRARFEFSRRGRYHIHFSGGHYTEYVFAGPSVRDVLSQYTWLTGRMQMPPLWALGHHQCRWYRYDRKSLVALADQYRKRGIPCDGLWLDIDYMDGYRVFSWNADLYPDPPAMLGQLEQDGFRTVTIVDPGVKIESGYAVYDEGVRNDLFCKTEGGAIYAGQVWPGKVAFADLVRPQARRWWAKRSAEHAAAGVAGIWIDMNEPATGEIPPLAMRFDGGRAPHLAYHNQYALLMAISTAEGLRQARPGERTFVLSRAGSAGIQRYAANWLGDNCSRWEHLKMGVTMSLGLGLSGQPFVGADVGGFAGNCEAELLARWYQCGALTPFFRNHACTGTSEQYPWSFGEDVEQQCREAIRLRYRLMPYLYASFLQAAEQGAPVMRPLVWEFGEDPRALELDDQYLLGDHLLVAPVFAAQASSRSVYVPEGVWYDWYQGTSYEGPADVVIDAPKDRIPLLVRAGAVVPMWPDAPPTTKGYQPEIVELHLFPPTTGGEVRSLLYEDDGLTLRHREGKFLRTELVVQHSSGKVSLEGTVTGEGFPELRRKQLALCVHAGASALTATVDGASAHPDSAGRLNIENSGQPFKCRLCRR